MLILQLKSQFSRTDLLFAFHIDCSTSATSLIQEYPSDPLRKISALQTKVELAGNLSNKQNLAENLAYRELASWKKFFGVPIAYIVILQSSSGWAFHSGCDHCELNN